MRFETTRANLGEGVIYAVVETPTKTILILNTETETTIIVDDDAMQRTS